LAGRTRLGGVTGWTRARLGAAAALALGMVVADGMLSRAASAAPARVATGHVPAVTVAATPGLAPIGRGTAHRIAGELVADLESGAEPLPTRSHPAGGDRRHGA